MSTTLKYCLSRAGRGHVVAVALITASVLAAISAFMQSSSAATNITCDTNALITAIQNAVNAGGTQVVDLASSCTYTLTTANNNGGTVDANGLPQIGNAVNLTINGHGAAIQRDTK